MTLQKDKKRFESIMLGHLDASYNLALWLLRDASEAEEVVQTAYLKAFEHFSTFTGGNSAGWMLTIVRNTAYNRFNKRKRESNLIQFEEVLHQAENSSQFTVELMRPEDVINAAASKELIMESMKSLSVEFREVLFLRELKGCSYQEISEITQTPKGTVMSRLSRARGQLRKLIVDQQNRKQSSEL